MNINREAMKALSNMSIDIAPAQQIGSLVFRGEGNQQAFNDLRAIAEDLKTQINIWESQIPTQ